MNGTELSKILSSLKLRVDQQPESKYNLATFVPIVDFASLTSGNTHIIYGRNGTGKTHLLKAFREYCEKEYIHTRIFPVYIDCRALELGTIGSDLDISFLVQRYYRLFVAKIVDALDIFANTSLTPGFFERIFGGGTVDRQKIIRDSIDKLSKVFRYESIEEKLKAYRRKKEILQDTSSKFSAGVTIKLDALDPRLEGNAGASAEETDRRRQAIELVYEGLAVIDYEDVRTQLESIVDQIGATAIIILIDEWSAIDLAVQPIFAEIIRKTLSISAKIYLKIVALRYFTRLTAVVKPPQRIGLQAGVDISPVADLDDLLCFDVDGQSVKDFLTLVAYRHCALTSDSVQNMSLDAFENGMCTELFESPLAYLEIIRASEGNPRDFLALLANSCSARLSRNKILSEKDAANIAVAYFVNAKEPTIRDSDTAAAKLYNRLFERVVQNRQKLFLISAEKFENNEQLRELLHFRFIHLVNSAFTVLADDQLPQRYAVFSMDYGKLASLKVARAGEQLVKFMARSAELLASVVGTPFLTGFIHKAVRDAGIGDKLLTIARTHVVPQGAVESGKIDPESLVRKYIYDDLL